MHKIIKKYSQKHNISYEFYVNYKELRISIIFVLYYDINYNKDLRELNDELQTYVNEYSINGEIYYMTANDLTGPSTNSYEFESEDDFNRFILENG